MTNSSFEITKAREFVTKRGKPFEKLKLKLLDDEKKETQKLLQELLKIQNSDGGIPFRFQKNNISTIGPTITFFKDILILELFEEVNNEIKKATEFLLSQQNEQGYFEEPEGINDLECSVWEARGIESNRIYCTSIVLNFLIGTKEENLRSAILIGADFLKRRWDDQRGFRSYPHSLWNAVPIFLKIYGENNHISIRSLEILQTLKLENYPSSSLVWMIECFIHAGYENHSFVKKILDILLTRQLSDGKWESEDGEEFDASTTMSILIVLKRLGKI